MQHRISLFVMFATCVALCALTGGTRAGYEAFYAGLPGGAAGTPGFTRAVMGLLGWLATWWWLCIALGAAVAFGTPALLARSEDGRRFLAAADAWMTRYQPTVLVVFVAAMFAIYWTVDLALRLPWLQIMEQLTAGG